MKKIFYFILVAFIISSCQSERTDLALNLEKGKEYKQVTCSKATISQDFMGQQMNMVMTINGSMSYLVNSVKESCYDITAKFEKLSMSMELPQGKVEFDSEKTDVNDVFSMVLSEMKNKPFKMVMTRKGKVSEIIGIEKLWEDVINRFDQIPEMQREQIKAQITKAYGAKALKGNIEMVTAIYPENPVCKGDKWNINTNLESGMSAKMSTEYEFTEMTSDYALIKGNSTLETADKDAYINTNGAPMKFDLKGSMLSEIKVDKKSGWIVEAKIDQQIKGDAFVKENSQMPNGMKIFMNMKNEMVITN